MRYMTTPYAYGGDPHVAAALVAAGVTMAGISMGAVNNDDPALIAHAITQLEDLGFTPPHTTNRHDPDLMIVVSNFQAMYFPFLEQAAHDYNCVDGNNSIDNDGLLGRCTYLALDLATGDAPDLPVTPPPSPTPPAPVTPPATPPATPGGGVVVWVREHPISTAIIAAAMVGAVVAVKNRKKIVRRYQARRAPSSTVVVA